MLCLTAQIAQMQSTFSAAPLKHELENLLSYKDEKDSFLLACVELPYVLPVLQERSELCREAVELQAVLQPQLCNSLVTVAVWAGLAVLMQADELEMNHEGAS